MRVINKKATTHSWDFFDGFSWNTPLSPQSTRTDLRPKGFTNVCRNLRTIIDNFSQSTAQNERPEDSFWTRTSPRSQHGSHTRTAISRMRDSVSAAMLKRCLQSVCEARYHSNEPRFAHAPIFTQAYNHCGTSSFLQLCLFKNGHVE